MIIFDKIEYLEEPLKGMIQEYLELACEMDRLLNCLTREYCAQCPRSLEYGCCNFPEEASRSMPEAIVRLQEMESVENGGDLVSRNGLCRFHTKKGCSLVLLKSPSCFGQLCDDLRNDLRKRFGRNAEPFIEAMRKFGRKSMEKEPSELLEGMRDVIRAGKALEDIKKSN
ncbi:hypothetical protein JW926_13895 [Candidatus Sumerlaeota bacterium]|nr:hypothetical protein [Candidatus Sumerlaeota bacterium]